MVDCNCIKAENTSLTLKKTFEFIQQYQVATDGEIFKTTIFLNINLLKVQSSDNINERVSADNTVRGIISYASDTNVIIIADSEVYGRFSEYTVEYSSIIEVISPSISVNYNLYKRYMNELPPICLRENDQYTEMLRLIEMSVEKYKKLGYEKLQIIFNGVKSRVIFFTELEFIKNLIVLDGIFILTLGYIGGFALIPTCENTEKEELKEGHLDV